MAKKNKKQFKSNLKLEALEQRQLLAGVTGSGTELTPGGAGAANFITAPNGNHYDQVLLTGASVSVTNDAGTITRVSFLDLQGDIVQAEFSGAGTLTVSMDSASIKGGVAPANYNQSGVLYEQGLASFSITGSDQTTNFSVFSVGKGNAVNSALFDATHTGGNNTADVQRLTVVANTSNPNGSLFGGIRAGNAIFTDNNGTATGSGGVVGITASNVQVQDVVTVGDVVTTVATGSATPTLLFGANSQFGAVTLAGGGLVEANGKSINDGTSSSYAFGLNFNAGATSLVAAGGTADITAKTAPAGLSFTGNNPIAAQTKSFTLTTGVDTIVGSAGNDSVGGLIGTTGGTNDTITALDSIDGGAGTDTLTISDVASGGAGSALPVMTIKNVEVLNYASAKTAVIDTSAASYSAIATVNVTTSQGADTVTAGATQNVSVNDTAGVVTLHGGLTQTVTTVGGAVIDTGKGAITLTDTAQGTANSTIDGGTSVTSTTTDLLVTGTSNGTVGKLTVGGTTAPTGAVTVVANVNGDSAGVATGGAIAVTGGTVDSITVNSVQPAGVVTGTATSYVLTDPTVTVTGKSTTTSVTVNQPAPVSAVNASAATAAVTESDTVQFSALTAGQTIVLTGGLTYTAPAAQTATQVATTFANLGSTGAFGWTTSAVSGANSDTVTFTSTGSGNVTDLANTGTGTATIVKIADGVASVKATAGVGGIADSVVSITDANAGASTATITSATLSNYAATSAVSSGALTSLTLSGTGGTLTVTNTAATSLDLSVSGLKVATDNTITNNTYQTVKVHTGTSADSTLTGIADTSAKTLTVDGSKTLTITSAAGMTNLTNVTVSGSAGLSVGAALPATVTDVNASATSGAVSVILGNSATTYEGGSGADTVSISAVPTKAISGGAGTSDTLVLTAADTTFTTPMGTNSLVTGFETLSVAGAASGNYDATGFTGLSVNAAITGGAVNFNNVAAGSQLTIAKSPGQNLAYNLKDSTGTADALTLNLGDSGGSTTSNVTATGVENVTIVSGGKTSNTITLTDANATSVTLTGGKAITLTGSASNTALTTVDGSAMTDVVTYTALGGGQAQTVKGGSAKDVLKASTTNTTEADTLNGGSGDDTLTANAGADTLTGGAGNDTFVVQSSSANVNTYTTITDASAGDVIKLKAAGTATFSNGPLTGMGSTAVFQDYANAAISNKDGSTNPYISWFQYTDGNTYIIESLHADTGQGFVNGTDVVVKLSGLVNLNNAAMVVVSGTPEIIIR